MIKHSRQSSLGKVLKPKLKLVKRLSVFENPTKLKKKKKKKSSTGINFRTTRNDTLLPSKSSRVLRRLNSCDDQRLTFSSKAIKPVKKIISVNKFKNKKKKSVNSKLIKIKEILISPIKKTDQNFFKQDSTIMKVLEII
jgi:hypothetical protein